MIKLKYLCLDPMKQIKFVLSNILVKDQISRYPECEEFNSVFNSVNPTSAAMSLYWVVLKCLEHILKMYIVNIVKMRLEKFFV